MLNLAEIREPAARQLRDEFEFVLTHQLERAVSDVRVLCELLGRDPHDYFKRTGKRKVTT